MASVALIWLVLHKLDFQKTGLLLSQAKLVWLVPGSLATFALMLLLALRWSVFLRKQGVPLPFSTVFPLTWSGQFFNSVLPGSTGGDFMKIFQLCRLHPHRKAEAVASVVIDRFSSLIALLLMAACAFAVLPVSWNDIAEGTPFRSPAWLYAAMGTGGALALAGGFAVARSPVWMARARRLFSALKTSAEPNPQLAFAIAVSFAIHLLNFLAVFCFARSLDLAISYLQILKFMPALLFMVMIPVTVNGHGLREILLVFYLGKLGIAMQNGAPIAVKETAIALSALLVANDLLWSAPGGLIYFVKFRRATVAACAENLRVI